MSIWFEILDAVSSAIVLAWVSSGLCQTTRWRNDIARTIWAEVKPFYLPAVAASYVLDSVTVGGPVGWWRIVVLGCQVACWFLYRDADNDDRWRRRKKLAERVVQRGGRLVVVAEGVR